MFIPESHNKTLSADEIAQIVDTYQGLDTIEAINDYSALIYSYLTAERLDGKAPAVSTVNGQITRLKKALSAIDAADELMTTYEASYEDKATGQTISSENLNYAGVTALLQLNAGNTAIAKAPTKKANRNVTTGKRIKKQSKPVNLSFAMGKALELLKSDQPWELAAAVALLTGRRMVEVLYSMQFEADDSHTMIVSTPAKKAGEINTFYRIPVLADSFEIEETIERLRESVDTGLLHSIEVEEGAGAAREKVNNIYSSSVRKTFIKCLRPSLEGLEALEGERKKEPSFHATRNAYAMIIMHGYAAYHDESIADAIEFVQTALAHNSTATTTKYLKQVIDADHIPAFPEKIAQQIFNPTIIGLAEDVEPSELLTFDFQVLIEALPPNAQAAFTKSLELVDRGNHRAVALAVASAFENTQVLTKLADETPSVEGYVEAAIEAIMNYNDEAADNADLPQLYISNSMVDRVGKIVRGKTTDLKVIRKVISLLEDAIDEHHAAHGITSKTSYALRRWSNLDEILETNLPVHYADPYA